MCCMLQSPKLVCPNLFHLGKNWIYNGNKENYKKIITMQMKNIYDFNLTILNGWNLKFKSLDDDNNLVKQILQFFEISPYFHIYNILNLFQWLDMAIQCLTWLKWRPYFIAHNRASIIKFTQMLIQYLYDYCIVAKNNKQKIKFEDYNHVFDYINKS